MLLLRPWKVILASLADLNLSKKRKNLCLSAATVYDDSFVPRFAYRNLIGASTNSRLRFWGFLPVARMKRPEECYLVWCGGSGSNRSRTQRTTRDGDLSRKGSFYRPGSFLPHELPHAPHRPYYDASRAYHAIC